MSLRHEGGLPNHDEPLLPRDASEIEGIDSNSRSSTAKARQKALLRVLRTLRKIFLRLLRAPCDLMRRGCGLKCFHRMIQSVMSYRPRILKAFLNIPSLVSPTWSGWGGFGCWWVTNDLAQITGVLEEIDRRRFGRYNSYNFRIWLCCEFQSKCTHTWSLVHTIHHKHYWAVLCAWHDRWASPFIPFMTTLCKHFVSWCFLLRAKQARKRKQRLLFSATYKS